MGEGILDAQAAAASYQARMMKKKGGCTQRTTRPSTRQDAEYINIVQG